jgi:heme-degrading monooxygenase HmoA
MDARVKPAHDGGGTIALISAREEGGEDPMITAVVQFDLPKPMSLEEAARTFESTAPKYQNLPGLIRKYYLRSEDGRRAGGVYLWQTKAAAEACYSGEWKARVERVYGSKPEILWFDTPVIVDNLAGGTITQAA